MSFSPIKKSVGTVTLLTTLIGDRS